MLAVHGTISSGMSEAFNFSELLPLRDQAAQMPALTPYTARDGTRPAFRQYGSRARTHLVLIHGSSGHSVHLHAFAQYLSARDVATVCLPDLRGHGPSPQVRGDIAYIGQLEDDLADLVRHLQAGRQAPVPIVVGGFSSGGGLALRFAGSRYAGMVQGVLLIAPYLGHDAPMVRQGRSRSGWARPNVPRIVALMALNAFGIRRFNGAEVLRFNLPERYRSDADTLSYSYRLMKGMHPDDWRASLRRVKVPLSILIAAEDEALHAEAFRASIFPHKPDATLHVVRASHLGLLVDESAMAHAARWIEGAVS